MLNNFLGNLLLIVALTAPIEGLMAQENTDGHSAPKDAATPYDFKGIRLGVTQEEFQGTPHPDGKQGNVVCSGATHTEGALRGLAISEVSVYGDDKELGITKCVWYGKQYTGALSDDQLGLAMGGGEYASYRYEFRFVPDPLDGIPKLFKIVAPTNVNALTDIIPALTDKFGEGKLIPGTMQTRGGATFDQVTYNWKNTVSTIFVQSRFTKVDDMVLIFEYTRLADHVGALKDARKASIKNRI